MRLKLCARGQNYKSGRRGSRFSAEEEDLNGEIDNAQKDKNKKDKKSLDGRHPHQRSESSTVKPSTTENFMQKMTDDTKKSPEEYAPEP